MNNKNFESLVSVSGDKTYDYTGWTPTQMLHEIEVLRARAEISEERLTQSVVETDYYRNLWEFCAGMIQNADDKIKPRGPDESRLLKIIKNHSGRNWCGRSDGWIT